MYFLFWKNSGIPYLPLGQRILYYNAMITQTMMYGSSVWVSTPVDNLNGSSGYRSVPYALFTMLILEQIVWICLENLTGYLFSYSLDLSVCISL